MKSSSSNEKNLKIKAVCLGVSKQRGVLYVKWLGMEERSIYKFDFSEQTI